MSEPSHRLIGGALVATTVVLSAVGQLGMKAGMQALHDAPGVDGGSAAIGLASLLGPASWIGAGLVAYALSMLAWLAALMRYPLSYAYPFLSLSYVLVYIGATHWDRLMEMASLTRTTGTLLILVGVGLASLTGQRASSEQSETRPGEAP